MFILEEPGAFYCLLKECKEEKSEDNINALKEEFFRYFRENGEALLGKEEEELKQRIGCYYCPDNHSGRIARPLICCISS